MTPKLTTKQWREFRKWIASLRLQDLFNLWGDVMVELCKRGYRYEITWLPGTKKSLDKKGGMK